MGSGLIQDLLCRLIFKEALQRPEFVFQSGKRLEEDALLRLNDENSVNDPKLLSHIFRDGCLSLLGNADNSGHYVHEINMEGKGVT